MLTIPDELAPVGCAVGEPVTSVRFPPLTENVDTKLWPASVDEEVLGVGGEAGVEVGAAAVDRGAPDEGK